MATKLPAGAIPKEEAVKGQPRISELNALIGRKNSDSSVSSPTGSSSDSLLPPSPKPGMGWFPDSKMNTDPASNDPAAAATADTTTGTNTGPSGAATSSNPMIGTSAIARAAAAAAAADGVGGGKNESYGNGAPQSGTGYPPHSEGHPQHQMQQQMQRKMQHAQQMQHTVQNLHDGSLEGIGDAVMQAGSRGDVPPRNSTAPSSSNEGASIGKNKSTGHAISSSSSSSTSSSSSVPSSANNTTDTAAGAAAASNSTNSNNSNSSAAKSSGSSKKPNGLRRGKWTPEEENYANRLIQEFKSGLLPLTDGTTLRTFLSKLLNCDPMRISKKFVGNNCIGKQVFRRRQAEMDRLTSEDIECSRVELSDLERLFLERVAQTNRCKTAGGGGVGGKGKDMGFGQHGMLGPGGDMRSGSGMYPQQMVAPWMMPPQQAQQAQQTASSQIACKDGQTHNDGYLNQQNLPSHHQEQSQLRGGNSYSHHHKHHKVQQQPYSIAGTEAPSAMAPTTTSASSGGNFPSAPYGVANTPTFSPFGSGLDGSSSVYPPPLSLSSDGGELNRVSSLDSLVALDMPSAQSIENLQRMDSSFMMRQRGMPIMRHPQQQGGQSQLPPHYDSHPSQELAPPFNQHPQHQQQQMQHQMQQQQQQQQHPQQQQMQRMHSSWGSFGSFGSFGNFADAVPSMQQQQQQQMQQQMQPQQQPPQGGVMINVNGVADPHALPQFSSSSSSSSSSSYLPTPASAVTSSSTTTVVAAPVVSVSSSNTPPLSSSGAALESSTSTSGATKVLSSQVGNGDGVKVAGANGGVETGDKTKSDTGKEEGSATASDEVSCETINVPPAAGSRKQDTAEALRQRVVASAQRDNNASMALSHRNSSVEDFLSLVSAEVIAAPAPGILSEPIYHTLHAQQQQRNRGAAAKRGASVLSSDAKRSEEKKASKATKKS